MSKTKTVFFVFVVLLLAGNAFSQRPGGLRRGLQRRGMATQQNTVAQEEGQRGIPGVTAPFIPFDEKDKIKYEDAVERAKKNDAEGFYWLAYYFFNGDGVIANWDAAGNFLQKAVDLGNAKACYLLGLYHNGYSLTHKHGGSSSTEKTLPIEMYNVLMEAGITGRITSLQIPKQKTNDPPKGSHVQPPRSPVQPPNRLLNLNNRNNLGCCFTNEVMTGYVIWLFTSAAEGGLAYATNDIARLERTIDSCRKCVVSEAKAKKAEAEAQEKIQAKSAAALDLLEDICEGEKKRRQWERYDQGSAYWSSWPTTLSNEERITLLHETEKKYSVVILDVGTFGGTNFGGTTNTWHKGEGKSLIVIGDDFFHKMDQDGLMISCGRRYHVTELDEIKWYNAEKEKLLAPFRKDWAKEHGMTLEVAIQKHKEWNSSRPTGPRPMGSRLLNLNNRPGLNRFRSPGLARGSKLVPSQKPTTGLETARARQQERIDRQKMTEQMQKEREREKKEREQAAEERKAQLEQLMQIQEELRRQREEKIEEQIRREHENGRP